MKNFIFNFIAGHLFKLVTERDFIVMDKKGDIWIGKSKLNDGQKKTLIEQAKTLQSLEIWALIQNEMAHIAKKKMFDEALTANDLLGGKFILYTLEVMSKKLYNISRLG